MASSPRTQIDDGYAEGIDCAICGEHGLFVQHLPDYPDFVTCRNCGSAFVVEDGGERVLYGNISVEFPLTSQFALKQWVWPEAVARRAAEERPAPPLPETPEPVLRPPADEPAIEEDAAEEAPAEEPDIDWLASRLRSGGMPAGVPIPTEPEAFRPEGRMVPLASDTGPTAESLPDWLRDEPPPAAPPPLARVPTPPATRAAVEPGPAAKPAAALPEAPPSGDPPPGYRHRVVVRGDRVLMPVNACAHCRRTPAPDRLPVPGSLPRADRPGARRATTFQVPLCRDCSQRARRRSPEQRGAAVMGHLTGALVGLVLVVGLLVLNVLPFNRGLVVGLAALGAAWLAGYLLTAALLVPRARRATPHPDAAFVQTTLRVGSEHEVGVTSFEFRQAETALGFAQANGNAVTTGPTRVPEASEPA